MNQFERWPDYFDTKKSPGGLPQIKRCSLWKEYIREHFSTAKRPIDLPLWKTQDRPSAMFQVFLGHRWREALFPCLQNNPHFTLPPKQHLSKRSSPYDFVKLLDIRNHKRTENDHKAGDKTSKQQSKTTRKASTTRDPLTNLADHHQMKKLFLKT